VTIIRLPAARHLTPEEVDAELGERQEHPTLSPIPDDVAVTIAAWWVEPSAATTSLALLADGGPVDADVLYDAVDRILTGYEQAHRGSRCPDVYQEWVALESLRAWAEAHCG
jgi:hypothetical protein